MSFEEDKQRLLRESAALASEALYEENELLLRDALDRFPGEPEVMLSVAASKIYKDPERAQELIGEALEIEPADSELLTRAGLLMFWMERYNEAKELGRRAAENVTEDFTRIGGLGFLVGKLYLVAGEDEKALEPLRQAFEWEPEVYGHGQALAEQLMRRGDDEEAMAVVNETLARFPRDEGLLDLRDQLHGRAN